MSAKSDAEAMPPPPNALPKTPTGSPSKKPPTHQARRSVSTKPEAGSELTTEAKQAQRITQLERKVARLENELLGQLQYNFRMEQLETEVR